MRYLDIHRTISLGQPFPVNRDKAGAIGAVGKPGDAQYPTCTHLLVGPTCMFLPLRDWLHESTFQDYVRCETRRQFFARGVNAVGWAALASLLGNGVSSASDPVK